MLNFSFIILISFLLVYLNIIILNEEILILICFIIFCLLSFNKLSKGIFHDFSKNSKKIENGLFKSLSLLTNELNQTLKIQFFFKNIIEDFKNLNNHFIKFNLKVYKKFPIYILQNSEIIYPKKLLYTQRLENQTAKLLALLLNKKLNQIINIQNFYTYNFKITNLLCINKIILREYIKSL
nr:ATP synthase F0 subunit b [Calliblepharis sp.]